MQYSKQPITHDQQLDRLISRGLIVEEREKALKLLHRVSYYRFSAYRFPFEYEKDKFKSGTKFSDIYNLYLFDHRLRILVMDFLETIEIALRTHLTYHMSHTYGSHGYLDESIFANRFNHNSWMGKLDKELERSSERFIEFYRERYDEPQELPIWMVTEVMSFGSISTLFAGLNNTDKTAISNKFNLHRRIFQSWVHTMVYIRNICAHHSRLWNKQIAIRPMIPYRNRSWESLFPQPNYRIFTVLTIMNYCLNQIQARKDFKSRLLDLLDGNPLGSNASMGFPDAWKTHALWRE